MKIVRVRSSARGNEFRVRAAAQQAYQATALDSDTTYVFTVAARDAASNCSTIGPSVTVTTLPLPPDQQIDSMIDDVHALVSSGQLNQKVAKALIVTLNAALANVEANRNVPAIEQLRAFTN